MVSSAFPSGSWRAAETARGSRSELSSDSLFSPQDSKIPRPFSEFYRLHWRGREGVAGRSHRRQGLAAPTSMAAEPRVLACRELFVFPARFRVFLAAYQSADRCKGPRTSAATMAKRFMARMAKSSHRFPCWVLLCVGLAANVLVLSFIY